MRHPLQGLRKQLNVKSKKEKKPPTRKSKKQQLVKQYIMLLARNTKSDLNKDLIKHSPDEVVKAIANACLNASKGEVHFTPKQQMLLVPYRESISKLATKGVPIPNRRKILEQEGGSLFLPLILSTVLGTLGSALFRG